MEHDNTRRRLSDILNGGADAIKTAWDTTAAAADFAPLPAGPYIARIMSGELCKAQRGTPGYKLTFKVLEGEHAGRQLWHDLWLTPAALAMTKRDLAKLGVTTMEQLERPLPVGIRCRVMVTLRKDDAGTEHNRVKGFEVLGVDTVEDDAFAPPPAGEAGQ